jgi:class 3 adenylate cyclase
MGDGVWRDLISGHFEIVRSKLERYGGREVQTTGDGILATFAGPAQALLCAAEIRKATNRDGLSVRAGVHVGEIDIVGDNVRGVAVHEAARIMSKAGADEILVSDITRLLASTSGLQFESRGIHKLKGLTGEWPLFAFAAEASSVKQ